MTKNAAKIALAGPRVILISRPETGPKNRDFDRGKSRFRATVRDFYRSRVPSRSRPGSKNPRPAQPWSRL